MLNFLSADNYKEAPVYASNLKEWYLDITGNNSILGKIMRLGEQYLAWCEVTAKTVFKRIGLYYWSDNAKLLCFSMVALGFPSVIVSYYLFLVFGFISDKFFYTKQEEQLQ